MTIGQPDLPREPKGTRPADNRAPVPPGSSTTGRYAWIFWQLKHRRVAKPVSSRSIRCSYMYQVRQLLKRPGFAVVEAHLVSGMPMSHGPCGNLTISNADIVSKAPGGNSCVSVRRLRGREALPRCHYQAGSDW
ncbi:hypothetical protein PC116_g22715 [Phytophthora cactorum]|nr:hypothetical protein PC119_g21731 [Phytophthora cactorum]KAG3160387.1 hypothetical protein PC128_g21116 [Phytophthora cactorum]KAG4228948.1 hypothetical protein PC116_g22715 [Phytophthora cactorum]